MAEGIIYGSLVINNKEYPFVLDKQIVKIVDENAIYLTEFAKIDFLEKVYGKTFDGRGILFLECTFHKAFFGIGNSFSISSYFMSYGDNGDTDFRFSRVSFYSKALNMFYSPLKARKFLDVEEQLSWRKLEIVPYEDTLISFSYEGNEHTFGIGASVNLRHGTVNIGELKSSFVIDFDDPIDCLSVKQHTQRFYDFLRFINYSSNIYLDAIDLFTKKDNGKYAKCATYHIFQDSGDYENDDRTSITIDDFDVSKLEDLYRCTVSIREDDNKLHLYYPKNRIERKYIEPVTWLSKALVFEGLFDTVFPDFKSEKNESFKAVKSAMIEKAASVVCTNNRQKGYKNDFLNHIMRYNGILEEKYNYVLRINRAIVSKILDYNEKAFSISKRSNYGKIYMDYRNKLAHGDVQPLDAPQIAVYRVLEAMVYLLLINNVGFSEKEKQTMIDKLFV